jgi:hypothetical protein
MNNTRVDKETFSRMLKRLEKEAKKHKKCEYYVLTESGLICECDFTKYKRGNA